MNGTPALWPQREDIGLLGKWRARAGHAPAMLCPAAQHPACSWPHGSRAPGLSRHCINPGFSSMFFWPWPSSGYILAHRRCVRAILGAKAAAGVTWSDRSWIVAFD